jgi:hypothetical protein
MADSNNNGIQDSGEISFHTKSALLGAIVALLIGGTTFTIIGAMFPDSGFVQAVGKAFAGGVCDPIKERLNQYEKAVVCYQATSDSVSCDTILP